MDNDKMMKGVLPGIIAGYIFLAFAGAGGWITSVTMGEEGASRNGNVRRYAWVMLAG